jgi:MraZ protein
MQQMSLIGTYECTLDDRSRLAIPSRLREHFPDGAIVGRWLDECAIVVPRGDWDGLVERTFGAMSILRDDQRDLMRYIYSGAFPQPELDKQGRIVVSAEIREFAGLEGKVKLAGAGAYLEMWNPDRLSQKLNSLRQEGVSNRATAVAERLG